MIFRRAGLFSIALLIAATSACQSGGSDQNSGDPGAGQTPPPTPPDVGSTTYDPCGGVGDYGWQGSFAAAPISFGAVTLDASTPEYDASAVPATFAGTILRPADTSTYAGKRPIILIEHGEAGNQCNLWWLAHALAGSGYVTLIFTQPDVNPTTSPGTSIAALASALAFVESSTNPFAAYSDTSHIGLAGHSEGAASVAYVQGLPQAASVQAIVAMDNLKHWLRGDPGSALANCLGASADPVTPRVPALGFAKDESCTAALLSTAPDIKETGWSWWLQSAQPSVEMVMKGYSHITFTNTPVIGGSSQELQTLSIYIQAWFDRWLGVNPSADQQLLACSVNGQSAVGLLSTNYLSGAYLPARGIQDADFRSLLTQTCPAT